MNLSTVFARVALVVSVTVLAVGCTAEAGSEHSVSRVSADRMSDDVFHSAEISLIRYVENKLIADCMERNGFPQLNLAGVEEHPGTFDYLVPKAPDWAIRSDEQARLLGFGSNSRPEAAQVLGNDIGDAEVNNQCRAETQNLLGQDSDETVSQAYSFANTISGEVADSLYYKDTAEARELKSVSVSFMDCLEQRGLRLSGEGERTLDSYGLFQKEGHFEGPEPKRPEPEPGSVVIVPAVPERRYVPSPEEADLAVLVAQCARQAGYADKFFELILRVTQVAIGKHEAELTELTPKIEALAETAAKLVGR